MKYEQEMEEVEIDLTSLSLKNGSALASINTFAFSMRLLIDELMRGVNPF